MAEAGRYDRKVVLIPRVLGAAAANGQRPETWPESGGAEHWAAVEAPGGAEKIASGLQLHTALARIRFRGPVSVQATDRIKVKRTGVVYAVAGVWVEERDTVAVCQSVPSGV